MAEANNPFVEYEKFVRQTKMVATVTEANINDIAKAIRGTIEYSEGVPLLIDSQGHGSSWKVALGTTVSWDGTRLFNESGVIGDSKSEWRPTSKRLADGD